MRWRLLPLLTALLLPVWTGPAAAEPPAVPAVVTPMTAAERRELAALGRRYRALRVLRARPGQFRADLSAPDGAKHKVMTELGRRLGDGTHTTVELRRFMGRPDKIARKGELPWTDADPGEETQVLWVYQWRGGHDWLFFEVAGLRVLRAGWYAAGE